MTFRSNGILATKPKMLSAHPNPRPYTPMSSILSSSRSGELWKGFDDRVATISWVKVKRTIGDPRKEESFKVEVLTYRES